MSANEQLEAKYASREFFEFVRKLPTVLDLAALLGKKLWEKRPLRVSVQYNDRQGSYSKKGRAEKITDPQLTQSEVARLQKMMTAEKGTSPDWLKGVNAEMKIDGKSVLRVKDGQVMENRVNQLEIVPANKTNSKQTEAAAQILDIRSPIQKLMHVFKQPKLEAIAQDPEKNLAAEVNEELRKLDTLQSVKQILGLDPSQGAKKVELGPYTITQDSGGGIAVAQGDRGGIFQSYKHVVEGNFTAQDSRHLKALASAAAHHKVEQVMEQSKQKKTPTRSNKSSVAQGKAAKGQSKNIPGLDADLER
jgi:hypothetical protein